MKLTVFILLAGGMAASAASPPDVEGWIRAVNSRRAEVGQVPAQDKGLAARKAVYSLSRTFPVLTDWILQDSVTGAFALMLPNKAAEAEAQLLQKFDVSGIPDGSAGRLRLYAEHCLKRREQRLRSVLEKWAPFAFTETHSNYATFIGYTEGLSDARFERFFKPGSRLSVLHFDAGGSFGRVEHLVDDPYGMLRDVDVSLDKKRLLYAWKKSDRLDDYHIYEYNLESGKNKQLTYGLGRADLEPAYLPDGDIIFASTRPEQSVPCWWNEICNLYRMDPKGRFIRRLAVDQVQTMYPQVLNDGQVCYTRWDYSDRGQVYPQPLFAMKPDGRGQRAYYGGNSWFPTSLLHARSIPGSHKVMAIAAGHHTQQHGKLVVIDVNQGRDEGAGMQFVAPVRDVPYERVDAAQQHGDQFRYPFPLSETELLVTYIPDWGYEPEPVGVELQSGNNILKKPAAYANRSDYGLYWMNINGERELLHKDGQLAVQRPVAIGYRPTPPAIPDAVDYEKKTGTLFVHDVYRGVGLKGIPRGEAKAIRVVRLNYRAAGIGLSQNGGEGGISMNSTPVSIGNGTWDVKEILGDAEIHPDGSALFEVPADESIYLQVLNRRGEVIQTTRSWDTVRPGEQKSCVGCHESPDEAVPSGKSLALQAGIQQLKPFYGPTRGFSFQREIQPILDRKCVSCHEGTQEGAMDLRGEPVPEKKHNKRIWSRSYLNLTAAEMHKQGGYTTQDPEGGIVTWISKMSRPTVLPPYFSGAAKSPLLDMLDAGHKDVKLNEEEYHKLAAWMDLLVPFCGTYREGHDWADHEMKKYGYYEEKRRQQHFEERREIANYLKLMGGNPPVLEDREPAPFTKASYRTVWESKDCRLGEGEGLTFQGGDGFLFDRVAVQAKSTEPVKLHLRKGGETIHTFEFKPGEAEQVWHSGGKVFRSGAVSLQADQSVELTLVQVRGVPETSLPEWKGYKPHLVNW